MNWITIPGSPFDAIRRITIWAQMNEPVRIKKVPKTKDVAAILWFLEWVWVEYEKAEEWDNELTVTVGWKVWEKTEYKAEQVNIGTSWLVYRISACLCAKINQPIELTWSRSLTKRRMKEVIKYIEEWGGTVNHNNFYPPMKIEWVQCVRKKSSHKVNTHWSSQALSAILLTNGEVAQDAQFSTHDPVSKYYVDMTCRIMGEMGVQVQKSTDYSRFEIKAWQRYSWIEYEVAPDNTMIANLITYAMLSGKELRISDFEGDTAVIKVFEQLGVDLVKEGNSLLIKPWDVQSNFDIRAYNFPFLLPNLAIVAGFLEQPSIIRDVKSADNKMSKRLSVWVPNVLKKLWIAYEVQNWDLIIFPTRTGRKEKVSISSKDHMNDHRIVLSLLSLKYGWNVELEIENVEQSIAKSFPTYENILRET